MFGTSRHQPVAEREAADDIERVYHEIRQVLRVSGVHPCFQDWAGFGRSFPLLWDAVRENAASVAFERAADRLRADAVRSALRLPPTRATAEVPLGTSQLYQIGAALALYHYLNPKLLLLAAAVRLALDEAAVPGSSDGDVRRLPRGVPPRMFPMELVEDDAGEDLVRQTFGDMRFTLAVDDIPPDFRTLALWPDYLAAAWAKLKPIVQSAEFGALATSLGAQAEALARTLPYRVKLARVDFAAVGDDDDAFIALTRRCEVILPKLILSVALLTLDGASADVCMDSPFPVTPAPGALS